MRLLLLALLQSVGRLKLRTSYRVNGLYGQSFQVQTDNNASELRC
jgi:hypothetical protein